jgi:hypothetical protein
MRMNTVLLENEIEQLYHSDQTERTVGWNNIDFAQMKKNDKQRLKRAKEIYQLLMSQDVSLSGKSLYQLGLLFQHSSDIEDVLIAKALGEMSGAVGYTDGDWLSAAAEDRYLIHKTGLQKWGTQFLKNEDGEWEQVLMQDEHQSDVTDEMRTKKSVPPRSRQLEVFLARTDI